MLILKFSKKAYSVTGIIFSALTIISVMLFFFHFMSIGIVMLFLGFTQLFNGLGQIKNAQQSDLKENTNGNKMRGGCLRNSSEIL